LVSGPEPRQHYEGDTLVIPVLEEIRKKRAVLE
jgi:hypothetical protein